MRPILRNLLHPGSLALSLGVALGLAALITALSI